MRRTIDLRPSARTRASRFPKRRGAKVLQRLLAFLTSREPAFDPSRIVSRPSSRSAHAPARPLIHHVKTGRATSRGATPSSPYGALLVRAAAKLKRSHGTRRATTRGTRKTSPPPGVTGVWEEIGPLRIPNGQTYGSNTVDVVGRVACIAVDPDNPKHVLVGAAAGGIWESIDTGSTWTPRADTMPSLAIGAIAFDPAAPTRVYAGSGEGNFYSEIGAGVYKSTDGGTTWVVIASAPFVGTGFFDLVVDPQTPSVLYAATDNGFYKSTNSGSSWSLKRRGVCWDVSVHPGGGGVEILAAFEDGLFASTNGGTSFTDVALPSGPSAAWTRLAVDRVASSPDVAYVFGATSATAFLWRRSGTSWKRVALPAVNHDSEHYSTSKLEIGQADYDWYVAAPPDNPGEVFVGAIDTFRGRLTGTTWQWTNITTHGANSIHPDQHCLTFAPNDSSILYVGNDGGIYRSPDKGATWRSLNAGLGICEISYLASDPTTWEGLLAGTQDNGTIAYAGNGLWNQVAEGDGGDCGINQLTPSVVYHSFYDVSLERSTNKGKTWVDLKPPAFSSSDTPPTSLFYPPVEVSGLTIAIGAKSLVVTRSGGAPWHKVPLGLTTRELPSAMREIDANTLLVGTNTGHMLRVSWNGTAWVKAHLTRPTTRYISCIAVDPANPQRFWVTVSQTGGGRVFRSDDAGASWINCTANLPDIAINAVVVDPANFQRVWVAADVGVYQTLDHGLSWTLFANQLPNAMAVDLLFHRQDRRLICATRNRGTWVMPIP
jgi:photosystem II stability/assembly factor-like uncharacterized protein